MSFGQPILSNLDYLYEECFYIAFVRVPNRYEESVLICIFYNSPAAPLHHQYQYAM